MWFVLLSHFLFLYPIPGALSWMPGPIREFLGHGWLGIDLFFVLSGFLITGILLDSRKEPHYFRNFYARRALRVLPLYFVAVPLIGLFYVNSWNYILLSLVFLANLAGWLSIYIPHGPGVLWQLATEEQFYLAAPWLVRFLNRRTLAIIAVSVVIVTPVLRGIARAHGVPAEPTIYELGIFRCDGLALGALLALWYRAKNFSRSRSLQAAIALLALDAALTIFTIPFGMGGTATPMAVAVRFTQALLIYGAGMLAVLAYQGGAFTAILRSRLAVLSGELSYCIYLTNLALADGYMAAAAPRIEPRILPVIGPNGTLAVRISILTIVTFGVAIISRILIERPFLKLKNRFA